MADATATTIDPRILEFSQTQPQAQPRANSTALPSRALDTADESDDEGLDGNAGSEKRRKLNLYKCKQCRDARKKVESTRDHPFLEAGLTFYPSACPKAVSGHRSVIVVVCTDRIPLSAHQPSRILAKEAPLDKRIRQRLHLLRTNKNSGPETTLH